MDTLKLLLLAVLVVQCWAQGVQMDLDDNFRMEILNFHNARRADQKACRMNAMTYCLKLEQEARDWQSSCEFGHQYGRFGENIARFSGKKDATEFGIKGCDMWYGEISDYKPGQPNCGYSCHYSQMVWANTTYVGCSMYDCKKFKYLACFYWPPGNYENQQPFETECSTPCRHHQKLDDQLCYGKQYKPIVADCGTSDDETTPEPTTTTTTPTTTTTATTTTTTKATTTTAPPPPPTTVKTDNCTDQSIDCERRAANGGCRKSRVKTICKKTCNVC